MQKEIWAYNDPDKGWYESGLCEMGGTKYVRTDTHAVDVEALRKGVKAIVESLEYYASDSHTDGYSTLETLHNNMPKENKAVRDFISQGYLRQPRDNTAALEALLFMNEYAVGNERFQDARYMDFKNAYETIREALKGK